MSKIICIDPGHGGKDPGGGSNDHFLEKNMVLDISKEQKKHFERNGIKVVMTRTTDEYLDSVPRTNRVKASGAKYCISNHINAAGGKGEGAETIHSIYAPKTIAQGVLDALVKLGAKYRRVFSKQGSNGDFYYMLRMTGPVQTTIIEYGFADHPSDAQKIIRDWKKYAEAVARYYIENVFKQKYIAPGKDKPAESKPTPSKPKPQEPAKEPVNKANLTVDGYWGKAVTRALQTRFNLIVDGVISGQYNTATTKALTMGTAQTNKGKGGSPMIRALQRYLGVKADGLLGPATVRALQKHLGTYADGVISKPSPMVKELQRRLNAGTF